MPAIDRLDAIEHRVDERAQLVERVAACRWPARATRCVPVRMISRTVSVSVSRLERRRGEDARRRRAPISDERGEVDEQDHAEAPQQLPRAGAVLLPTWNSVPSGSRTDATSSSSPSLPVPSMPTSARRERRGRELRQVELPPRRPAG